MIIASPNYNKKEKLFIVVGRESFSSGLLYAVDFKKKYNYNSIIRYNSGIKAKYTYKRENEIIKSEVCINAKHRLQNIFTSNTRN
jgi:hypothetical protein